MTTETIKKATFGAGCFWGVEAAFRDMPGVVDTAVGYAGGHTPNPSYQDVCTDRTGHAEVVEVEYDPTQIPYERLVEAFFSLHDPTQLNRQGPDFGTQYRSVVFCHDSEQERVATAIRDRLAVAGVYPRPIVTQIVPAAPFHRAEEYHQRYLEKRGRKSCSH